MELPVPGPDEWQAAVTAATGAWGGPEEWEMRLVCTRGPEEGGPSTAYILGQELSVDVRRKRRDGIAAVTISREMPSWRAGGSPWLLLGAKTLSYAVNLSAQRWARSRAADDAIFVGTDGNVWEASTSSVVVAVGRRLLAPPPSVGILASISTDWLFRAAATAGWEVRREELTLDDLYAADGLWLTSSVRGLVRVHTLDGKGLAPASAHAELAALAASN
jgi:4-amino-4-deoxychorismate lyase